MECPTICDYCREVFDLHDGKRDPRRNSVIICASCVEEIVAEFEAEKAGCQHEYEWRGGGSTSDSPIEPEQVCKYCGAVNDAD